MPAERFFAEQPLKMGESLYLENQEHHHLVHVMRVEVGETIELVNGSGALAKALVERVEKKRALLRILNVHTEQRPSTEIILAQAIPRSNRIDFILEKGTELGMTQLWLFPAIQGERKRLTEHQFERLRGLTIAAMKQCGRLYLPTIIEKPPLAQWEAPSYPSFFGDTDPKAPPFLPLWQKERTKGIVFYIGPESGFTETEIEQLHRLKAKGVKLHPHILRTDTAALTALSLITHTLM